MSSVYIFPRTTFVILLVVINKLSKPLTSVCSPFVWELCLSFSKLYSDNSPSTPASEFLLLSNAHSPPWDSEASNTGLSAPCLTLWCHLLLFHSLKHPRPERASHRLKVWCNSANTTWNGALWRHSEPRPRMGSLSPWAACNPLFLAVSLIESYLLPADIPLFLFIS